MVRAWQDCGANPASQHASGRKARRMLEDAREGIAELLGAKTGGIDADQVIFTSGGTEANNLALMGLLVAPPAPNYESHVKRHYGADLLLSTFEHPSIRTSAGELQRRGLRVSTAPATDDQNRIHDEFTEKLDELPQLCSVMLANNETGALLPVRKIADACEDRLILIHTDAVQAVGKIRVNFRELGVHTMTVAPHKFHGPLGIGALVLYHDIKPEPQLFGGFQQAGLRPGTENVALAVGFYQALKIAVTELPDRAGRMQKLRDELESQLMAE